MPCYFASFGRIGNEHCFVQEFDSHLGGSCALNGRTQEAEKQVTISKCIQCLSGGAYEYGLASSQKFRHNPFTTRSSFISVFFTILLQNIKCYIHSPTCDPATSHGSWPITTQRIINYHTSSQQSPSPLQHDSTAPRTRCSCSHASP